MTLYEFSYTYYNYGLEKRKAYFISKYPMSELDVMITLYQNIYTEGDDEISNITLTNSYSLDDKKWIGIVREGAFFYE